MPDAGGAAILGQLDPIANGITTWGWVLAQGAIEHRYVVGFIVTAVVVPFAVVARRAGGRTGWGVLALLAGTWGQVFLFSDLILAGAFLVSVAVLGGGGFRLAVR